MKNVMKMHFVKKLGQVCAVVGAQWGDEGKGKLVDILAGEYDIIARATGGANAGHTIYKGKEKVVFHLIPAGMLHAKKMCVMGNGMVIHFPTLFDEVECMKRLGSKVDGRLLISGRAHIVFEYHKFIDRWQEERKGKGKVGTTLRGIGPAYTDKMSRMGIRVLELANFDRFEKHYRTNLAWHEKAYGFKFDPTEELIFFKTFQKKILKFTTDTSGYLSDQLKKKKSVLLEGANGTLLDVDHGTYPFVTSSNASVGGMITGTGIAPRAIKSVIGILKAYVTRVGEGPFPTELLDETGQKIRMVGGEFGATTGRPRRCGWFDAVVARYAVQVNGFTSFNLTKLDVLSGLPKLKIAVSYIHKGKKYEVFPEDPVAAVEAQVQYIEMPGWKEDLCEVRKFADLPKNAQKYVKTLEKLTGVPMQFIGVGAMSHEMIVNL